MKKLLFMFACVAVATLAIAQPPMGMGAGRPAGMGRMGAPEQIDVKFNDYVAACPRFGEYLGLIATSFLTLKSNSFRSMWSLADSNVEALSISENYVDYRYIGYIQAEKGKDIYGGSIHFYNQCNDGAGACMYDKWHNFYDQFTIDCVIGAFTSSTSELLNKIKEICAEIKDEGGLMAAIAALFKK